MGRGKPEVGAGNTGLGQSNNIPANLARAH